MEKIEENSIRTQVKLSNDIMGNYRTIGYAITEAGKQMREYLATKKINEEEKTVTIDKAVFDKLLDLAYTLQTEENWGKLSHSANKAIDSKCIKIEILGQLQNGIY